MNTSISISIPTTGLVMDFVDQTDILLEYSVLPSWIFLHDMTKVVRVVQHFILYKG